jgi:hypothetical protein
VFVRVLQDTHSNAGGEDAMYAIRPVLIPMFQRTTLCILVLAVTGVSLTKLLDTTEASPYETIFTNPDGSACTKPCLLGVRPGETVYEKSIDILQSHPLLYGAEVVDNSVAYHWPMKSLILENIVVEVVKGYDATVSTIRLGWKDKQFKSALPVMHSPSLGELNVIFDSPKSVVPQIERTAYTVLHYDANVKAAIDYNMPVNVYSQILYINISATPAKDGGTSVAWQGFANAESYGISACRDKK